LYDIGANSRGGSVQPQRNPADDRQIRASLKGTLSGSTANQLLLKTMRAAEGAISVERQDDFADALKNRGDLAALICFLPPASSDCLWSAAVQAKPEEEQRPAG
jgi:hypothetical protein